MARVAVFGMLLAVAVLAAGSFGALHNQISYSVGPDYFQHLKFQQFRIPPEMHTRVGAALVGWQASWWMGMIVGFPAFALGFVLLPAARGWRAGKKAIFAVLLLTTIASGMGVAFGYLAIDTQTANQVRVPGNIPDKVGFLRAGVMHDASYLGGILGVIAAVWIVVREWRSGA